MMPRYFSSVVRIISQQQQQQQQQNGEETSTLTICGDGKSIALPKEHADKPFTFDRVYFAADDNAVVYKGSVKEIVEGSLLGYHGTIISTGECGLEFSDTLSSSTKGSPGIILKAADHIFVCIKRSKSRTGSSLVVLCSYLAVINEKVYDLLRNYGNTNSPLGDLPVVTCNQGQLAGQSAYTAKNSPAILKFLSHGEKVLKKLKEELNDKENNVLWHTVFTLTVEHAQFGAQFAPVSGTLSFVQLSSSQQQREGSSRVDSYGNFAAVIDQLANTKLDLKSLNKQPADYHKSVLTEILREALGGNCRTLLITHVGFTIQYPERLLRVLSVGSKACTVHNQPNKRDLAEQALMSAYMKELRQIYGDMSGIEEPSEGQSLQVPTAVDGDQKLLEDPSQTSVLTAEIDDTYDELIKDLQHTNKSKGKRFVEMAANALAEAALGGDESSSEGDDDTEEDASNVSPTADREPCSSKTFIGIGKKDKGKSKRRKSGDTVSDTSSSAIDDIPTADGIPLICSLSMQGFSGGNKSVCEALAAILQDPDRGAHRVQDRKNIKIRKDVGALFSGASIVQWMVDNLAGLETSEEAEKLGQLLLDQNTILHSEGSRVFANAESLFYYVHRPRAAGKMLSQEQVAALLAQAEGRNATNVTVVEKMAPSEAATSTTAVSPVVEYDEVKNSSGDEGFTQANVVERSLVKETSLVEAVTRKSSSYSGKGDDNVSDIVVLPSSDGNATEGQQKDHVIQQLDYVVQQQGSSDHQQQQEIGSTQETAVQQEATNSSSNLANKEAPPTSVSTHTSSTSIVKKSKYASEASMFAELRGHGIGTSTSSMQLTARKGKVAPWNKPGLQQTVQSYYDTTSNSSGLNHLEIYDDDGGESLVDDGRRSYSAIPNVVMTTNSAEIEDYDNVDDYPTPLHMAAALGKKDGVIANLSMMYAVDNVDEYGRTPLMYATIKNKVRSCQALIKCGAQVNQANHTGTTALHYAAYLGLNDVIVLLLNKKAIPSLKDSQGQTALHLAIVPNTTAPVQLILKSVGMCPTTMEDNHKLTPIHWAIAYKHVEQLKAMIKSIDLSKLDSHGRSLLNYSITYKSDDCTQLLVSSYPSMMHVADGDGFLPIHKACMQESTTPLTILLQENAAHKNKNKQDLDLNVTDCKGRTALHWSAQYNRIDVTELLLKHGASKDIKDQEGLTPLDISLQQHGDDSSITKLLQQEDLVDTGEISVRRRSISRFCILL